MIYALFRAAHFAGGADVDFIVAGVRAAENADTHLVLGVETIISHLWADQGSAPPSKIFSSRFVSAAEKPRSEAERGGMSKRT